MRALPTTADSGNPSVRPLASVTMSGLHAGMFDGQNLACAGHPALHFVGDRAQPFQERGGSDTKASLALDRLHDERGDASGVDNPTCKS